MIFFWGADKDGKKKDITWMVNGKTFTKKGNALTWDGKTINARGIEKAIRTFNEKFRAKPPQLCPKRPPHPFRPKKNEDSGSRVLFSMAGDGNYADKIELHQLEAQKKITDELFLFRDLPRGSRLDNTSVTAVRQLLENNVATFPEKIKKGFVKIFESLVSFKPPKGMGTITAENFVTSAMTADCEKVNLPPMRYMRCADRIAYNYARASTESNVPWLKVEKG